MRDPLRWKPREEARDPCLVLGEGWILARGKRFGHVEGCAGEDEEAREEEAAGESPVQQAAGRADGKEVEGPPHAHLAKVVGVARVGPQAALDEAARIGSGGFASFDAAILFGLVIGEERAM